MDEDKAKNEVSDGVPNQELETLTIIDIDIDDFGPDDPDGYEIISPSEKPYTVILFDSGSAFAGSSAVQATSHIVLHAETPEDAASAAIVAAQRAGNGIAWKYPEVLFLTEGYHQDLGPGARRQVR